MDAPRRWQPVQAQLEDFRRYLYGGSPIFVIKPLYTLPLVKVEKRLAQQTKLHRCRGVYLLYNQTGTLRLVGKGIFSFEKRVEQHPEIADADSST